MDSWAIIAHGIQVSGEEGPVYGPLDLTIPATGLTVLTGRSGSGRTALALTLSGRMKPTSGELTVLGETTPSKIRTKVAIAGIATIDELDRDVRLSTILTEHRAWSTPWLLWVRKADQAYYESLCKPVFEDRDLPALDAYISQLTRLDRLLIRLALALHPVRGPKVAMLIMDDLEQVHEQQDRNFLITVLTRLAETMPVVVNAVNPLPDHPYIALPNDAAHTNMSSHGTTTSNNKEYQ